MADQPNIPDGWVNPPTDVIGAIRSLKDRLVAETGYAPGGPAAWVVPADQLSSLKLIGPAYIVPAAWAYDLLGVRVYAARSEEEGLRWLGNLAAEPPAGGVGAVGFESWQELAYRYWPEYNADPADTPVYASALEPPAAGG